ncbi:MAG: hypothetical protein JRH17_16835 [Deltaproteobacteria bacterium]|nr:hypothetical protein [Deltaproteobacteria bacterium]
MTRALVDLSTPRPVLVLLLLASTSVISSAGAVEALASGSITLLSDNRGVSASGSNEIWDDETFEVIGCTSIESDSAYPSPDYSNFSDSASAGSGGWGSQTSTVSTSGFTGSGGASGYSDYCWGFGYSTFEIEFHVDNPVSVHLSGDLWASGYTQAMARLKKGTINVFLSEIYEGSLPFDHQAILDSGDYTLTVLADGGNAWVDASYEFALTIEETALVPLLGSAGHALLLVMLAGAGIVIHLGTTSAAG